MIQVVAPFSPVDVFGVFMPKFLTLSCWFTNSHRTQANQKCLLIYFICSLTDKRHVCETTLKHLLGHLFRNENIETWSSYAAVVKCMNYLPY